jgi:hypothetical protein
MMKRNFLSILTLGLLVSATSSMAMDQSQCTGWDANRMQSVNNLVRDYGSAQAAIGQMLNSALAGNSAAAQKLNIINENVQCLIQCAHPGGTKKTLQYFVNELNKISINQWDIINNTVSPVPQVQKMQASQKIMNAKFNPNLDQDILNFCNTYSEIGGKKLMRLLQEARPELFVKGAENQRNKENLPAYSFGFDVPIWEDQSCSKSPTLTFCHETVDLDTGSTNTYFEYRGNGYRVYGNLVLSHRVLTQQGKQFFKNAAK